MSYPNLTRSLLAMAIAGASIHASAATVYDISEGPMEFESKIIPGPITVTGSFSGDAAIGTGDVFEIEDSTLIGSLILDATITTKGGLFSDPDHPDGTVPWNGEAVNVEWGSHIKGNVINKGHLEITGGFHSEVFELDDATIDGDLINEGKIIAGGKALIEGELGHNGENPINVFDEHRSGLVVGGSKIGGNLINSGEIKSSITGTQMLGGTTDLYGINIKGSTIKGSVINSGSIIVEGNSAGNSSTGIMIEQGEYYDWDDWDPVKEEHVQSFDHTTVEGQINNSGTIAATGKDAVGVRFGDGFTVKGGLHNTGTIHGDTAGIQMEGTDTTLNITQAGGKISGGEYAINQGKDGSKINLDLAGGKIDGNLDVNDIIVTGRGTITADAVKVNSKLLVNSGNQLDLRGNSDTITLNVANGFTVSSGGVLGLELNAGQDSSKPMVDVKGDLTFESGSTVSLSAVKGLKLDGEDYFLIQASTITADDEGLVKGTALLKVNSYENVNGELHANVSVVNDPAADVKGAGASGNAQAAAGQVLNLIAGLERGNAANKNFAEMLLALDETGLAQAAEQMTPDVDHGAATVAVQGLTLMSGVTSSRTSGIRGQSSGAALTEAGVWAQGLYSDARQGTRNEVAGYNAYTSGMAIGADAKVTDSLTVGVAYGYMDSTVNSKRGNTTEVDGHSFTVYGGYELDNYFVDSSLTYSKNENKSKRQILNTTAKGTYDSNTLGLSVLGGYDFKLDGMIVSPLVGMNYSNTKLDGFTEKGSAAALRSGSQRYEIAELGVGARLSASYPLGQGRLEPQVQAMVYHDFAADRAKSTSAFVNAVGGNSFIAYGAKPERTSYQADVGVDYKIGAFTVSGSYGYVGKKGFDSDTIAAKIRYDF